MLIQSSEYHTCLYKPLNITYAYKRFQDEHLKVNNKNNPSRVLNLIVGGSWFLSMDFLKQKHTFCPYICNYESLFAGSTLIHTNNRRNLGIQYDYLPADE